MNYNIDNLIQHPTKLVRTIVCIGTYWASKCTVGWEVYHRRCLHAMIPQNGEALCQHGQGQCPALHSCCYRHPSTVTGHMRITLGIYTHLMILHKTDNLVLIVHSKFLGFTMPFTNTGTLGKYEQKITLIKSLPFIYLLEAKHQRCDGTYCIP